MNFKKSRIALLSIVTVLSSVGLISAPAHAATATPYFMSFEAGDALGADIATNAAPGHPTGTWQGTGASISAAALPGSRPGKALELIKGKSGQAWSGLTMFDAGSQSVQFTNTDHPVISMDFYSPVVVPIDVQIKIETVGSGAKSAYKVLQASTGWSTLSFDFSTVSKWSDNKSAAWSRVSILPNWSDDTGKTTVPNNDQHFFLDNISINGGTLADVLSSLPGSQPNASPSPKPVYMNFESADGYGSAIAGGAGGLGAFEGASLKIATSVGGRSDQALKFTKSGQQWSGFNALLKTSKVIVASATNKVISFDYYSSDTTPVMVKLETDKGNAGANAVLAKTVSTGWNALSFDMSTATGWSNSEVWTTLAIFPDFGADAGVSGQVAPSNQVYYIDNISINGGTLSDVGSPNGATPTPTSSACNGKPSIRLISPSTANDDAAATWWQEVSPYNDEDTKVYTHYFPVGSTVALTYQVKDNTCAAVAAGRDVYLAVNARYSAAQTSFLNYYLGAIKVINPIDKDCKPPYCAGEQTVLSQKTNAQGQVTFTLINTNRTSTESKPSDLSQICNTCGTPLVSLITPSLSDYNPSNETGAGGNNLNSGESVDKLIPHFVSGLGEISSSGDPSGVVNSNASVTFTVKNADNTPVANQAVQVTTDDGGFLVSPDSSAASADDYGYTTVNGMTDANGRIVITAKGVAVGIQTIRLTYALNSNGSSAINGYASVNWTAPVIKVAQTIGSVATRVKVKGLITLPAKTNKALTIKWTTSTPKICSISAGKVKGLAVGTCKVLGSNVGNATTKAVSKAVTIAVTR